MLKNLGGVDAERKAVNGNPLVAKHVFHFFMKAIMLATGKLFVK